MDSKVNMTRFNLLLFLTFASISIVYGQNCDCESNFEWVKKTFEENDAGFALVLEQKGEDLYQQHNAIFREKTKSVKELTECTQLLYQWLTFFRKGHIGIVLTNAAISTQSINNQEIIGPFTDWETHPYDKDEFYKYLDNLSVTGMEGVWQSGIYTVGIIKQNETEYTGFIIEADGIYWKQGQVKLKIDTKKPENNTVFYMKNHSEEQRNAELSSNNCLQIGDMAFSRLYPLYPKDSIDIYLQSENAQNPYMERLSDNTLLLRIPTFDGSYKEIDSIIAVNKSTILNTENLIIDIRNNGGGSDRSFQEILPLLYTNPIRIVWVEYLSTKLNNQRMLDFSKTAEKNEDKERLKKYYDTLESKLGQFVNLRQDSVISIKFDTIFTYPKNVGIIINQNNASSAEEFLLESKQSKKVKVFGTPTFGAIDISNMYFVDSPCKEFQLGYCLTKRLWLPDMVLDNVGIQPDFYIDKSIPKHKWVDFVNEVQNKR